MENKNGVRIAHHYKLIYFFIVCIQLADIVLLYSETASVVVWFADISS